MQWTGRWSKFLALIFHLLNTILVMLHLNLLTGLYDITWNERLPRWLKVAFPCAIIQILMINCNFLFSGGFMITVIFKHVPIKSFWHCVLAFAFTYMCLYHSCLYYYINIFMLLLLLLLIFLVFFFKFIFTSPMNSKILLKLDVLTLKMQHLWLLGKSLVAILHK